MSNKIVPWASRAREVDATGSGGSEKRLWRRRLQCNHPLFSSAQAVFGAALLKKEMMTKAMMTMMKMKKNFLLLVLLSLVRVRQAAATDDYCSEFFGICQDDADCCAGLSCEMLRAEGRCFVALGQTCNSSFPVCADYRHVACGCSGSILSYEDTPRICAVLTSHMPSCPCAS